MVNEVAFPLLGSAFVLSIVLPLGALLAKVGLSGLEQGGVGALSSLRLRYLLVAGSSWAPLAWFFSAGIHQAESGRSALVCLLEHTQAERCFEPFLFSALLGGVVTALWLRAYAAQRVASPSKSELALLQKGRIEQLIQATPQLRALRGRIVVTDEPDFTLCVSGLLRPQVTVGANFAENLPISLLESALAHELAHVQARDPLKYAFLDLALAVNPLGPKLVGIHAARWKTARELACDREAVLHGAEPLALAEAIVRAARPRPLRGVALSTNELAVLRLRVELLVAFAEQAPQRRSASDFAIVPLGMLLLIGAVLVPHQTNNNGLDLIHAGAEYAIAYFQR